LVQSSESQCFQKKPYRQRKLDSGSAFAVLKGPDETMSLAWASWMVMERIGRVL